MSDTKKCCLTAAHESCQVLLNSTSPEAQISLGIKKKKKGGGGCACACEMLSQRNLFGATVHLLPHPACSRPVCCVFHTVHFLSRTLLLQAWRGQMKPRFTSMLLFFLCSWHKSKRKKNLLAQSSGLFIFLPAATCYPLRGSRKTSHGLGWSDMSNPNSRPGPSQWITTLSGTYYIYTYIYVFFFKLR